MKSDWEKEFDERFVESDFVLSVNGKLQTAHGTKIFIHNLLATQRAEDQKRIVEGISKPFGLTRRQVLMIINQVYGGEK